MIDYAEIISSKSIFTLFLIISANYLASLFNCSMQRVLQNNIYVKHLFGFMTMYAFVILEQKRERDMTFKHKMILAITYYTWFVLIMRADYHIMIAIIVIFFIMYEISDNYKYDEKDVTRNNSIYALFTLNVILTVIGVIIYYNKQLGDYKKTWSWAKFFLGVPKCRSL